MNKKEKFDLLIEKMSKCNNCINLKDKSLINFYENKEFSKNIPSIWTDWYNRLDSKLMIIGQDWGPYEEMKKFYNLYKESNDWNKIIEEEKSLTKKQLLKFIRLSSNSKVDTLDNIYITNAIMCARYGNNYRSNNINLKYSTISCSKFLKEQIEIVNPKVILTLGYNTILSLSKIYNFKIESNLKETIKKYPIIKINNLIIIPAYHPVAQIKIDEQLNQYNKIWKYI